MEANNSFTIKDLSSKCKSKNELYNMLVRDGQLYLPQKRGHSEIPKRCDDGENELL